MFDDEALGRVVPLAFVVDQGAGAHGVQDGDGEVKSFLLEDFAKGESFAGPGTSIRRLSKYRTKRPASRLGLK